MHDDFKALTRLKSDISKLENGEQLSNEIGYYERAEKTARSPFQRTLLIRNCMIQN